MKADLKYDLRAAASNLVETNQPSGVSLAGASIACVATGIVGGVAAALTLRKGSQFSQKSDDTFTEI